MGRARWLDRDRAARGAAAAQEDRRVTGDEHRKPIPQTAALGLAGRGWQVFPLVPGGKRPAFPNHSEDRCDRTDRWCRRGHVGWEPRATTDRDRITRSWGS